MTTAQRAADHYNDEWSPVADIQARFGGRFIEDRPGFVALQFADGSAARFDMLHEEAEVL